jgi:beta-glucosidase-like glycosyl hydrolase
MKYVIYIAWLCVQAGALYAQPGQIYKRGEVLVELRVHDLLQRIAFRTAEQINAIQKYFIEQSRLGIPIIAFDEALHGLVRSDAAAFPQSIALAATWDTALAKADATVTRLISTNGYWKKLTSCHLKPVCSRAVREA